MRRIALLLLVALTTVGLTACSGAEGRRAQDLLQQSERAMGEVKAFRFAGRMWFEAEGLEFTLVMRGGGETKPGGASYVTLRAEGVPGFPEMTVVTRDRKAWLQTGGSWTSVPVPAGQANALEQFDMTPYVEEVEVEEGVVVGGEPAAKVTGLVDTARLFEGMLGQLGSLPGGRGSLPAVSESFGDTRVVLYISERTHLLLRGLMDMSVEADGERADLHFDFALEPAKRVRVPIPG